MFHYFPKDREARHKWECMIRKSLDNANFSASDNSVVCSNHFPDRKPTLQSPFPTCCLTESDVKWKSAPIRQKKVVCEVTEPPLPSNRPVQDRMTKPSIAHYDETQYPTKVPMHLSQITRESDVKMFTGIKDPETFKFLFEQLSLDARHMIYWRGEKQTHKESALAVPKGPPRKLLY